MDLPKAWSAASYMDILVEKLGPGVKNIQRAGWSSAGSHQRVHQRDVLRDAQADAAAGVAVGLGGMEWALAARIFIMSCGGRESHVGEISHFLTFCSRIALVAIEGLVIFWHLVCSHLPFPHIRWFKVEYSCDKRGESNTELKVQSWQSGELVKRYSGFCN